MNQENQLVKRTTNIVEEFEVIGGTTRQPNQPSLDENKESITHSMEDSRATTGWLGKPAWGGLAVVLALFVWFFPTPKSLFSWWFTPMLSEFEIGNSTLNYSLSGVQIGNGPNRLLLIGGVHGDEPFSAQLVAELAKHFLDNIELVPPNTTLYFLPVLNPDGLSKNQRMTSTGVDLNRNWQTDSWQKDAMQPGCTTVPDSGGNEPFSEPETDALSTWLLNQKEDSDLILIISYHTHFSAPNSGGVQPGYIEPGIPDDLSDVLAKTLEKFGYTYQSTYRSNCNNDTPTGEFINWAATKGLTIVEVELPSNGIATDAGKQAAIQKALESIIAVVDMLD